MRNSRGGPQMLEDSAREACDRLNLVWRPGIPTDDSWHYLDIHGDHRGRDDGRIKLFSDCQGGIVWNWKQDACEPFFVSTPGEISPEESARRALIRRQAQEMKDRARAKAQYVAGKLWERGATENVPAHPYIARKGVKPYGVRVLAEARRGEAFEPAVLVPVWDLDANKLLTVQRIFADSEKRFLKGCSPAGGQYVLNPRDEGPTLIGEGFATVATAADATGFQAVCAFGRTNLRAIAAYWARRGRKVVILGELDADGVQAAKAAALATGSFLALPDFAGLEKTASDTDFNDLAKRSSLGTVRKQIKAAMSGEESGSAAGGEQSRDEGSQENRSQAGGPADEKRISQEKCSSQEKAMPQKHLNGKANHAPTSDRPSLILTPGKIKFRDPATIPPREFLYGDHYIRKYVSITAAPGGTGKTALATTEILAMVTSRPLLGVKPITPLRVWYIGEDDTLELERRFAAALKRYGVADFETEWLFINSFRDLDIVVYSGKEDAALDVPAAPAQTRAALIQTIREHRLDVLVVDPTIRTHTVDENKNKDMDSVMRAWTEVADKGGCAVELLAHSRKGMPGAARSIDDVRGGSAQVDAARHARVLMRMDPAEAGQHSLEPDEAWRYVRFGDAKANMSPMAKSEWYRLDSVCLGNGDGIKKSDSIQVPSVFKPKSVFHEISMVEINAIMREIEKGIYRRDSRASNWIGKLIRERLAIPDTPGGQNRINRMLNNWTKSGAISTVVRDDEQRRSRAYCVLGNWDFSVT